MNKLKNLMDTPMTWGGYFKLAGWSAVISFIIMIAELIAFGVLDPLGWIKRKFRKDDQFEEDDFLN